MIQADKYELVGYAKNSPATEKTISDLLIEIAPNIIIGLADESKIVIFNKFAEKLTGYRAEEVLGKKWVDIFIPQESRTTIFSLFNEIVVKSSVEHHYENPIVVKNGEEIMVSWYNTVLLENGKFKIVLSLGTDVTGQRKMENDLRKKVLEMERFQSILMGREDRILELKKQVKELKLRLGET
ncbi:hypothetical protein A3K48_01345 [candidate division WOR-1 bacterium RIFOXYA12_FULL_52_29]|uniref:PAS domain-containing protein n=1 Tax=candidate division WOR-1 bacterium RIFOXYC12_FULL_54_18 TaxID=1802584 RepID=A0A1F4T581_UNCSA|nr:MAG: hypothetical protein A3K44_01345 [candidate division WOR-1 bacterium RIFOXYA2_FULL_51_19]OGC17232.1 MAG: hypothetical protein A3K48_01345 [candidate division WOR-1 bacterium RIFOXYA12_FULL_52_29]OGC26092.1 MAG: hypothetical protein A3K32_01340 [candidate division WOR-1 bacterium RIFOXYB2_FULL_45_9]OGC27649.1 MAG: hypothetical protein A3K49_01345 [candidate division WOR-1 bacterium RIFOXYC12_FULL_54_18]OGC29137.1 MAG: hypothetical protein A2346_00360 [candidate division WOR-1 bacterium R